MTGLAPPSAETVAKLVRAALEEDAASADATSAFLGIAERPVRAEIRVGAQTMVSGMAVAREVFRGLDASVTFEAAAADGDDLAAGAVVARVEGPARSILAGERTALNFLQRMCGVATHAARFVAAVHGTGVVILDTRKTIPLWREFDKYAVRCGGAHNHRRDLRAMVLAKDNHVRVLGGPGALIRTLPSAPDAGFVEIEVDTRDFLDRLLAAPAAARVDRVMLDNFTPADVAGALTAIAAWRRAHADRRLEVEVSGGVTLDTIRDYTQPGVDFISVGAITHSAPAAPMSLEVL